MSQIRCRFKYRRHDRRDPRHGQCTRPSAPADLTNGPGAVPVGGGLLHPLEERALGAADVGDFDHGARMELRIEIGEAALLAADLAFVPYLVTERQRTVVERV